jgi:hypothetical protein
MKKNPSLTGLLLTVGIIVICYLVYIFLLEKKDSYLITNPTDKDLRVKIDNQNYIVAPNQITEIELEKGKHRLNFNYNGQQTDTTFDITRANAVINPTRAEYFVFVRPYGAGRNRDSLFTSQTLTIDKKVYYGNIKRYKDLYIQDFYYNLGQDYPKIFLKKGEPTDISKIFSKEDFKQFYFENYE